MRRRTIRLRALPLIASVLLAVGFLMPGSLNAGTLTDAQLEAFEDSVELIVRHELAPQDYKGPRLAAVDTLWHPDVLGNGYEARTVNEGSAFDGPVVSTIVRRKAPGHSGKAVLYVHGFNDYFFQSEMGEKYNEHGINFYAVDLRRYGRSLRPWQYPFNVRNAEEYFVDIDSALNQIRRDGNTEITFAGHSTGGLTTALYVATRGARCGVKRLVTNSPFLEWNFSSFYRHMLIPAVSSWGALSPNTKINQGHCDAYSHSLLKQYHGEWEYNTAWKMVYSPPVTASWIRSITRAQSRLMKNAGNITVPVLVMHSSRGLHECGWTEACQTSDIVLDPEMIARRGAKLGRVPQVVTIDNGIHDLILSELPVREHAYEVIFNFIENTR